MQEEIKLNIEIQAICYLLQASQLLCEGIIKDITENVPNQFFNDNLSNITVLNMMLNRRVRDLNRLMKRNIEG